MDRASPSQALVSDGVFAGTDRLVRHFLPDWCTVLVVSKGDDSLLQLGGCTAHHFPQAEDGQYLGYHPATSGDAIAHLEALRQQGADFLLFPPTALWWLDHYTEFRSYLLRRYRLKVDDDRAGVLFSLREDARLGSPWQAGRELEGAEGGGRDIANKAAPGGQRYALWRDQQDMKNLSLLLAFALERSSNCVDIGAHRGSVLGQMMRYAPDGRHIAYEPLPHLCEELRARFPSVTVHCTALADEPGEAPFLHVTTNPGYSGLRRRNYPNRVEIDTVTVRVSGVVK